MDSLHALISTLERVLEVIPIYSPNVWPLRGALSTVRAVTRDDAPIDTGALERAARNLSRARYPADGSEQKMLSIARKAMSDALHRLIRRSACGDPGSAGGPHARPIHLRLVERARSCSCARQGAPARNWQLYRPPELKPEPA